MATRKPSKARDFDYSNVGKAGRRTGITLKEGKLDEHGMEEIDGMFSSPEKSPVKTNGRMTTDDTVLHSDDMETGGSSSIPEPADLLSSSRAARNSFLRPPRSRSPMKTFMSGSPRRTPGIRSSPMPQSDQLSSPTSSRNTAKRAFNFTASQTGSPLKVTRSRSTPPESRRNANKGKGKTVEVEEGATADFSDDGNHLLEEEDDDEEEFEQPTFIEAPGDYHEGADVTGDHSLHEQHDYDNDEEEAGTGEDDPDEQPSPSVRANESRRGQKRKEAPPAAATSTTRANQATRSGDTGGQRRGRKPKEAAQQGVDGEGRDERPAKKAKTSRSTAREGNVQLSAEQQNDLNQVVENYTKRNGPLDKNRSLCILRREDPSDDTIKHTRSGRASVRPLAYWRNEKFVYGKENDVEIGQRFPVSTIKEIIRMEEQDTGPLRPGKRGKRSTKKKKGKSKKDRDEPSDDEAGEHAEAWETEGGGVFYGPVKVWDPELQAGTQEEEMMDVGYAPAAIQTHEVKDSTFRFAKILSTPFLGSGFVEMPPGAVKKQKNSKRMHMVFFVYHGRIHVDIAGLQFSAGKGCVFQVPRGNNYSFENDYDKPATIFFTQGCIPLDPEGNVDTTVTAPPLPDPATVQAEAPGTASEKPAKKKGRPKKK